MQLKNRVHHFSPPDGVVVSNAEMRRSTQPIDLISQFNGHNYIITNLLYRRITREEKYFTDIDQDNEKKSNQSNEGKFDQDFRNDQKWNIC